MTEETVSKTIDTTHPCIHTYKRSHARYHMRDRAGFKILRPSGRIHSLSTGSYRTLLWYSGQQFHHDSRYISGICAILWKEGHHPAKGMNSFHSTSIALLDIKTSRRSRKTRLRRDPSDNRVSVLPVPGQTRVPWTSSSLPGLLVTLSLAF